MSQRPTVEEVEDEGTLRTFNKDERSFLRKYVEQYRNSTAPVAKKELLGTVAHSFLKKFFPNISGYERTSAKRMIKTFFANNNRKTTPGAKFWNKVMSRRDVAYKIFREEFNEWSGGPKTMLGANGKVDLAELQRKFSRFLERLTPEQNAELDQTCKEWEDKQYPPEVQIQYHRKFGVRFNMASDHSAFTKMGEYRLTLIIAPSEDGRLETTWSDNIASFLNFEINSIKEYFPSEWDRLYTTWRRYAMYLQGEIDKTNGAHIPEHLPSRSRALVPGQIILPSNEAGFPIMPAISDACTGVHCLRVMRAYLNAQYSIARGGIQSKVPILLIADHPDMLAPGSLPPGFSFRDICQLRADETKTFCRYIHKRQETTPPENVFRFLQIKDGRTGNVMIPARYPGSAGVEPARATVTRKQRQPRAKNKKTAAKQKTNQATENSPDEGEILVAPKTHVQAGQTVPEIIHQLSLQAAEDVRNDDVPAAPGHQNSGRQAQMPVVVHGQHIQSFHPPDVPEQSVRTDCARTQPASPMHYQEPKDDLAPRRPLQHSQAGGTLPADFTGDNGNVHSLATRSAIATQTQHAPGSLLRPADIPGTSGHRSEQHLIEVIQKPRPRPRPIVRTQADPNATPVILSRKRDEPDSSLILQEGSKRIRKARNKGD